MKFIGFGAGSVLSELKKDFVGGLSYLVDNDNQKFGCRIHGLTVYNPNVLLNENKETMFIWILSKYHGSEISSQLEKMGFVQGRNFINIFDFFYEERASNYFENSSLILLSAPRITRYNDRSRLICEIDDAGESKELWLEVHNKYEKYLFYERSDAFLVGILRYAMETGKDIKCTAPVTEELLYNLETVLIPILSKYNGNSLFRTKIYCDTESKNIGNAGGVGTGISCGVDSFHAINNFINPKYKGMELTHLCIFNLGSFGGCYGEKINDARTARYEQVRKVAEELGLPLIETDSNYRAVFPHDHNTTHSYSDCFAIFALKKLWKAYYYASGGYEFTKFSVSAKKESAYHDLLIFNCFSHSDIRIYSEGMEKTRLEKVVSIADFEIAQKYLNVCLKEKQNCNICSKCRLLLVELDILGKLDNFKEVFDINYYLEHRNEYFEWLYERCNEGDDLCIEACEYVLKHIGKFRRI